MMKTVSRFVTRMQGEDDGLFIGTLMKSGKGVLKPNTVYEIREVLGELQIVEIGQGVGAGPDNCVSNMMNERKNPFHWGSEIGYIIGCYGQIMFLTYDEYMEQCQLAWEKYGNEK